MEKSPGNHRLWFPWRKPVCHALVAGVLVSTGCGKKPATQTVPANAPTAATSAQPDMNGVLQQLTQDLRKYSFEKQRVPATFNEFQAAAHPGAVPAAPAGKKFAIDAKMVQVVLVNQ